jgi:adenosine deaminase
MIFLRYHRGLNLDSRGAGRSSKQVRCRIDLCQGGAVRRSHPQLFLVFLLFLVFSLNAAAATAQSGTTPEQRTSYYFESVTRQPSLLLVFLRDMPKGGDLHNHLSGSIYAENLIDFAAQDGLCVDRVSLFLSAAPCDASCERSANRPAVRCSYGDQSLYNALIDAWSMRNWQRGHESGHDHFFSTFDKFRAATSNHVGDAIAEAVQRAAADHLRYVELMHTADNMQSAELGAKLGRTPDFAAAREKLLSGGLQDVIASARKHLDGDEAKVSSMLQCGTVAAAPGCEVTVRYLYQVLRGLPPESVFAQMVTGFELASTDPRFVGINLVMPEDSYVPMHDFDLHMRMLDYLHGIYPKVHISLHAGELAMGLVPPEGLRFHIRESIERGHAERIGHGVSVMNEREPLRLLREMAQRGILVEICLTSNDVILGVEGPLPLYRRYGVPVALATDDEGVSRSDLTQEYLRAVGTYHLSYVDLKEMARQSLEHSFLPGSSLWGNTREFRAVGGCEADRAHAGHPSLACQNFLNANERARSQWKLEEDFSEFEAKFSVAARATN